MQAIAGALASTGPGHHLCGMPPSDHHAAKPGQGRNWAGPLRKTPGRVVGTSVVRLYQLTLSGFVGNSCRHLPTCSEYAYEAIDLG
jgi:hypothetical protein